MNCQTIAAPTRNVPRGTIVAPDSPCGVDVDLQLRADRPMIPQFDTSRFRAFDERPEQFGGLRLSRWCWLPVRCVKGLVVAHGLTLLKTPNSAKSNGARRVIAKRINNAGITASAHFTINPTIDPNGMFASTTETRTMEGSWRGSAIGLVAPSGCCATGW